MVDAEVTINDQTEGAATKNVDTESLTVGAKTVQRQRIQVAGATDTAIAAVQNSAPTTEFGVVTRNIPSGTQTVSGTVAVTNANLDAGLSTLSTEATLALIKAKTDNLDVALSTLESLTTVGTVTNLSQMGGVAISLNTGVRDTGTQRVTIATNDVVPITDNSGTLTVDAPVGTPVFARLSDGAAALIGSKTSANSLPVVIASDQSAVPVSGTVTVGSITAGDNNIGNVDIVSGTVTTVSTLTNQSQEGGVAISLNTGVRDTGTRRVTIATDDLVQCVGSIAHDTGDSGNPVKIGGVGRQTNPTAVTDGDRVNATFDDLGKQVVVLNAVRDLVTDQTTTIAASTAETTICTQAASIFHDIVLLTVANTSATATRVDFRDTTAGSVRFSLYCPAGATVGFAPPVPLKQATVNTNWTATCITSLTDLRIFVQCVSNV